MRLVLIVSFISGFILTSCIDELNEIPEETIGLAPIYASVENWDEISISDPEEIQQLGKIYYKAPYIYATDKGKGIHIIDNTNPEDPVRTAFLRIIGNSDLAIRGDILYANNLRDLVAIDISDLNNVSVVDRLSDVFINVGADFPQNYAGFFECVDPQMGPVAAWFETTLIEPQCWR
ncbi:MAG: hypothetical protein AAF741_11795 [Bacteroidota bacterium]